MGCKRLVATRRDRVSHCPGGPTGGQTFGENTVAGSIDLVDVIERSSNQAARTGLVALLSAFSAAYNSSKETAMPRTYEGMLDAKGCRFGLVVSRFNDLLTNRLVEGALDCLARHGAREDDLLLVKVPGSWEIALAAQRLAASGKVDAVIGLGVLVRGATPHFDYIASEAAKGLAQVALGTGIPVAFGILTCDTLEQALERAGAKAGNKGWQAAQAAIEMVQLYRRLGE
jgi:6,7-dimethyl-8-ribityllumazine synthase